MYYRNANCAVVVYDITQPVSQQGRVRLLIVWLTMPVPSQSSLEKAKSWIRELQRQADSNIVIALAGNKTDLASRRAVSTEEAQKYAEEENLLFLETSAKDSHNVSELFTMIARKLPLEQATNAQRAGRGSNLMAGAQSGGRAGVDLRGGAQGHNDACNC